MTTEKTRELAPEVLRLASKMRETADHLANELGDSQNADVLYGEAEVLKRAATALAALTTPQERDARSPEFEAIEQELWKHQPVFSMDDGSIRGCQCLDRVFHRGTEDWGTHLAEVFMGLGRDVAGEIEALEAEHDAALAAVERVRAIAERHGVKAWTEEIFAALDGAPEPEWEYEYADDDDPEGNVYGQLRRVVGPWLPVPGGEGETS